MYFGAGHTGMPSGLSSSFNVPFVRTRKKNLRYVVCNDTIPS